MLSGCLIFKTFKYFKLQETQDQLKACLRYKIRYDKRKYNLPSLNTEYFIVCCFFDTTF